MSDKKDQPQNINFLQKLLDDLPEESRYALAKIIEEEEDAND